MVRKRSWPAVSQICSLIRLPSSSIVLILKSILCKRNHTKFRPDNYFRIKRILKKKEKERKWYVQKNNPPNSSNETCCEGTIRETQQEATLSNTCIAPSLLSQNKPVFNISIINFSRRKNIEHRFLLLVSFSHQHVAQKTPSDSIHIGGILATNNHLKVEQQGTLITPQSLPKDKFQHLFFHDLQLQIN